MTDTLFTMTDCAASATLKMRQEVPDYRGKDLRIYLAGKGCDGFDYGVAFDTAEPNDLLFKTEHGITIICDERTMEFVRGSTLDWADDDRGRGYLVLNPNHRKFRGKFYRKPDWKAKLSSLNGQNA